MRLICLRDLRDQLRDRCTVIMIALLPLVLYPVLGVAVLQFAVSFVEKPSRIGIVQQHNSLLVGVVWLPHLDQGVNISAETLQLVRLWVTPLCNVFAGVLLWRLSFASPLPSLERTERTTP